MALVLFDPRVCLDVSGEGALDGEGAVTLATLVGFLVCVDANMAHKITGLFKLLATVGTLMPAYTIDLKKKSTSKLTPRYM